MKMPAGTEKIAVVIIAQEDTLRKMAKEDMKKIAQAAGVETNKTARILMRHGLGRQQKEGLEDLNRMLKEIRETGSMAEAVKWGMVASGYANGMCCGNLMSKSELHDVIQVIDQAFRKAELRIKSADSPFWLRIIRKKVKR